MRFLILTFCIFISACAITPTEKTNRHFTPLPDNFLGKWDFLGRPDYDIYFDVGADGIIEERKKSDNSLTRTMEYTVAFQDNKRSVYILTREETPFGNYYNYEHIFIDIEYLIQNPERIEWNQGCSADKKNWTMSEQDHRQYIADQYKAVEDNEHILAACTGAQTHFYRLEP